MASRTEEPVDRRAQILDAAVAVISRRGVDRARLADVAEEADVSLGLVQHYFRTRERLLVETFRREQERISSIWLNAVPAGSDPLLRLVEYLRLSSPEGGEGAATAFDPGWSFWLEFWSKANRDEEIRAEFRDIYNEFAELFGAAIRDGVQRGEFHPTCDAGDAADRLISLIDGVAMRTLLGGLDRRRMLPLLIGALTSELGLTAAQRRRAARYASRKPAGPGGAGGSRSGRQLAGGRD
ncbi:MAG TPA: TetR/AcrR family transcriptional regulator [Gaiellales bacterium]|jgi:AcrR family transcriptional regulator|nr:TetR/AcrR family transcriptional regulator [Gaiellales bacterium]